MEIHTKCWEVNQTKDLELTSWDLEVWPDLIRRNPRKTEDARKDDDRDPDWNENWGGL